MTSEAILNVAVILLLTVVVPLGLVVLAFGLRGQQRLRELAIQERIALIEKGLVPSPEVDPGRFETLVGLRRPLNPKAAQYRSTGVLTMGLGAAMTFVLTFAGGVPAVGFGAGGGLAILGLAVFINGTLIARDESTPGPASGPGSSSS